MCGYYYRYYDLGSGRGGYYRSKDIMIRGSSRVVITNPYGIRCIDSIKKG